MEKQKVSSSNLKTYIEESIAKVFYIINEYLCQK